MSKLSTLLHLASYGSRNIFHHQTVGLSPVSSALAMQVRFRRRSRVKKFTPPIFKKKKPMTPKQERPPDELVLQHPLDDVYFSKYYLRKDYSLADIITMHRETCHSDIFNHPNTLLKANIMLDMRTKKTTKFMAGLKRTIQLPHKFDDGKPNRVLAFCKDSKEEEMALEAGATYAGFDDIVHQILSRELQQEDFEHVVCTMDTLPKIGVIRKQLGMMFPQKARGSLGVDIGLLVHKFANGTTFESTKPTQSTGKVDMAIGTLDMETEALIKNFQCIINDLKEAKAYAKQFITDCSFTCYPSPEIFFLDKSYIYQVEQDILEEEEKKVIQSSV